MRTCLVNQYSYDLGCLVPAILIIGVLSFMRKRVRLKPNLWNGRPGLPVAVDFLGDERNRFIIPFAFGATAASAFSMFFGLSAASRDLQGSPWAKAFQDILMTLLYGIINYPYMACLNAEYKIVGYIMGLLYSFIRLVVDLVAYFGCTLDDQGKKTLKLLDSELLLYSVVFSIPVVVCTLILVGSYSMLLFKEIQKRRAQDLPSFRYMLQKEEMTAINLVGAPERTHVHLLFSNQLHQAGRREHNPNDPWYTKLKDRIYVSRPDFKFSMQFLSSYLVSCIFVYQLTVLLLMQCSIEKKSMDSRKVEASDTTTIAYLKLLLPNYLITSVVFAALLSTLQLCFFLRSHRNDVLKTYTTRKCLLPDEILRPKMLVDNSLSFCGYQIAFTAVGLFINAIAAFSLLLPIYIFHWLSKLKTTDEMLLLVKEYVLDLLPLALTSILAWISLILLVSLFVIKDHTNPDISITINNRRLFGIVSYFFFFLNILVGFWSSLIHIAKGAVLGLLFLPRIDRTSMMNGFERFDRTYMAYIGFLNVLVAFRHPVMLCFCQFLLEGVRRRQIGDRTIAGRPRVSGKALNRWFLAVLLMRNPSLVRYRKQGVHPAIKFPSSSSVQLEMPPIGLEKDFPPEERLKSLDVY